MKRKILSIVLSLAMVFTMIPAMGAISYAETEGNYLTFTSSGSTTVSFEEWADGMGLQYSVNDGDWTDATSDTSIALNDGQTVKFQADAGDIFGFDNYLQFKMEGEGTIAASGSVMSLFADQTKCTPYCCFAMFYDCTSLTSAPELPATTLANDCFEYMFYNCTGLTEAPDLPAEVLANNCYCYMFQSCTRITEAPNLPATALRRGCYYCMFESCRSLTSAPELPATTLEDYCYYGMFQYCTDLSTLPELPATTLAKYCYEYMFYNCTGIKLYTESSADYPVEWSIPADATTADGWNYSMFVDTGGDFIGNPEVGVVYYQAAIPISSVALSSTTYTYNGKAITPTVTVKNAAGKVLTKDTDYTITYKNNTNAGTATVTVTGIGDYAGTIDKNFTINPASIGGKTATLSTSKYVYSGKAKKPSVTVSGLTAGTDYTVAYKNNTKVGKATVTITGKGNYAKTITKTFKINPKQAAVSKATPGKKKLTVKMKTKVSSTGGATYQIAYKQKGTKKWKYTTTTKQSKVIKKLKKGKRYYVKVRAYKTVSKVKYYGAWSKQKLSKKIK